MKTLSSLFAKFPRSVTNCFIERAVNIQTQLNQGQQYRSLGGRQLKACRNLIRFKLGSYRLIFKRNVNGMEPEYLVHRKNLEALLKRRCS